MARKNPHVISVRLDDEMLQQIGRWAKQLELYNAKGDLNISVAVKLLLSIGLQDYTGQQATQSMYKIARASIWNDFKIKLCTALTDLSSEM